MGFRHFYGFNLAMLGKQGWQLLTNQDTILSQVFKAKYYPKEGFLEAKLGHNPSYVWRSIHASQVVELEEDLDGDWETVRTLVCGITLGSVMNTRPILPHWL
jgi:hypothetical protein